MKKYISSIIIMIMAVILLGSCTGFQGLTSAQGVINVQGNWRFTMQSSGARDITYASVDIVQNGEIISGVWHGIEDVPISGTVDLNYRINIKMSLRGLDYEFKGTVSGINNSYINEGHAIIGSVKVSRNAYTNTFPFSAGRNSYRNKY